MIQRLSISITGKVQGVGFRPYIYRIADKLHLSGWVTNTPYGVLVEIQGVKTDAFIQEINKQPPSLAKIDGIRSKNIRLIHQEPGFTIRPSQMGTITTKVVPDAAICQDCLFELFDPDSRYYQYPFINCTHCGPRYTITKQLPYDRAQTTMDQFPMCGQCAKEYQDIKHRRFHAEAIACLQCGPCLSHSIEEISSDIKKGKIIALKGMGGYQLICDAGNEATVNLLRQRKQRKAKPFALMLLNTRSIYLIAECPLQEAQLLNSCHRPIVLLRKKGEPLPSNIAPGLKHLGIMLPCTPIHYLIFHALLGQPRGTQWLEQACAMTLVVTSANISGQPLIIDDQVATISLKNIADKIVSYNRGILNRVDDSVLKMIDHAPQYIRRARGYVPNSIRLPHEIPSILALGAQLKNTFCITRGNEAFVSQHIGDLEDGQTIDFFDQSLSCLLKILDVKPEAIAHDRHPDFYTTALADHFKLPAYPIQHHHAHLASIVAEQHLTQAVLGLVLDGYGYGLDGNAWGGELLWIEGSQFKRIGHLLPIAQPGGDAAAREPWRMAASILYQLGMENEIEKRFPGKEFINTMLKQQINSPKTSSCGRLFDAASALLGVNSYAQYEGHAAMLLESLVTVPIIYNEGWDIQNHVLSLLPLFARLIDCDPSEGANLFHGTLIAALSAWIKPVAFAMHTDTILLSGGCLNNSILAHGLLQSLRTMGLNPRLPHQLAPNDSGLCLGQAWIAGVKILSKES